jgi:hypothetical protein
VIVVLGNRLVLLERLGLTLGAAQALNLHQYFCLLHFSILLLRELLRGSSSVSYSSCVGFCSLASLSLSSSKVPLGVRRPRAPVLPVFRLRDPRIRYSKPANLNPVISKPRTSRRRVSNQTLALEIRRLVHGLIC